MGDAGRRHDATATASPARRSIVKDKVIVGITGGEFGPAGFLDAYDAATGKRLWRFYTIPGPGEFGNDTWKGDSWKTGGGADVADRHLRSGAQHGVLAGRQSRRRRSIARRAAIVDNLFSDSVVALDPDTGRRKWHYQFTPNDGHDWDSVQDMILVDRDVARPDPQAAAARRSQRRISTCSIARTAHSSRARRSSTRTGTQGFDDKGRPSRCPDRTRAPRAASSCIRRSAAAPTSRRRRTAR